MNEIILRPYQLNTIEMIKTETTPRVCWELIMGAGKNIIIQKTVQHYQSLNKRVLLITDLNSVIEQLKETANKFRLNYDIFSQQKINRDVSQLSNYDVIIIDECHTCFISILKYIKDNGIKLLGFTATATKDLLGIYYEKFNNTATYNCLLKQKYLTPIDFYSDSSIKTDDIHYTTTGNIVTDDLKIIEDRIDEISANLISDYKEKENGNNGIILVPSIKSAQSLCNRLNDAGIKSETYISDGTKTIKQNSINLQHFREGLIKLLISVNAISKGFDAPIASFLFDCRPRGFKSGLDGYVQSIGRVCRIYPNKLGCRVYDYVGNIGKFGYRLALHQEHGGDVLRNKDFKIHNCERCNAEYDGKPPTICRVCKDFTKHYVDCYNCNNKKHDIKDIMCKKCDQNYSCACGSCGEITTYLLGICIHCHKSIDPEIKERKIVEIAENRVTELKKCELPKAGSLRELCSISKSAGIKAFMSTIKYQIKVDGKTVKNPVYRAYYLWKEYTNMDISKDERYLLPKLYDEADCMLYLDCIKFIKLTNKKFRENMNNKVQL